MAPKLKFGAKPGAKSGAKFGTKRGAKWCHGAKLSAQSRTLQLCCTGLAYDGIGPAVISYKSSRAALHMAAPCQDTGAKWQAP